MPAQLLAVERKVLHAGGGPLRLDSLNRLRRQLAGLIGILAVVLEVAAAERTAHHVDAGSENHILAPVARLGAEHLAEQPGALPVPGGGECGSGGQIGGVILITADGVPAVRSDLFAHAVRTVGHRKRRNSQPRHAAGGELGHRVAHIDLFRRSHFLQQGLNLFFDLRFRHETFLSLRSFGENFFKKYFFRREKASRDSEIHTNFSEKKRSGRRTPPAPRRRFPPTAPAPSEAPPQNPRPAHFPAED